MKPFTYLSLGAGVQSTALLILANQSKTEPVEVAVFADTQSESPWVYENLERLKAYSKIPIHVVSEGNLAVNAVNKMRFSAMPLFTRQNGKTGMLRRQCTREYKITPIEKHVRTLMGFAKGERIVGKATARSLQGISYDEWMRMKPNRTPWITNVYPLVDMRLTRNDCKRIIEEAGLPVPGKSACYFCPYHDDKFWADLKANHPEEFARAVEFDGKVRNITNMGVEQPVFVHRSLRPLGEVIFQAEVQESFGFMNECEGMCGV